MSPSPSTSPSSAWRYSPSASTCRSTLTSAANLPAKDEVKRAVDETAAKAEGATEATKQDVNHALGSAAGKARDATDDVNRKLKNSTGGP